MLTRNQKECLKHMLSAYELTLDKTPGQDETSFRFGRSVACSMLKSFLIWICDKGISKEDMELINNFDIVTKNDNHKMFIEGLRKSFLDD